MPVRTYITVSNHKSAERIHAIVCCTILSAYGAGVFYPKPSIPWRCLFLDCRDGAWHVHCCRHPAWTKHGKRPRRTRHGAACGTRPGRKRPGRASLRAAPGLGWGRENPQAFLPLIGIRKGGPPGAGLAGRFGWSPAAAVAQPGRRKREAPAPTLIRAPCRRAGFMRGLPCACC